MLKMVMVMYSIFGYKYHFRVFLNGGENNIEGKVTISKGVGLKNNLGLKRN